MSAICYKSMIYENDRFFFLRNGKTSMSVRLFAYMKKNTNQSNKGNLLSMFFKYFLN